MTAATGTRRRRPPLLDALDEVAATVARRWARVGQDELAFPPIASEALTALPAGEPFDPAELVRWAIESDRLPTQGDGEHFGEPPVTVHLGDGFKIDVLFWLDGTTTIHQHMFAGAFRVLVGSSIHSHYRFEHARRVSSRMRLGRLVHERSELLRPGDTHAIEPGPRLVHSLFHLERPSATIVVRTRGEDDMRPQFDYLRPGIALDPTRVHPDLRKRIALLRMLRRSGHPAFRELLLELVRRASVEAAARLLAYPELVADPEVRGILGSTDHFGDAAAWLARGHDEALREYVLVTWRRALVRPEHRFFLALLLNVPTGREILAILRRRFGAEPVGLLRAWIVEIAAIQARTPELPPLVDVELDALGALGALVEPGRASDAPATAAQRQALRGSILLAPLFAEPA